MQLLNGILCTIIEKEIVSDYFCVEGCPSYHYLFLKTGEMISGFVPSQLKEARLLANFRFISTTPTELGAARLTFVRHDMY